MSGEKHGPKGYVNPEAYCSSINKSRDVEANQVSVDR